ncbi:alpha-1,4-glucan--maltose-1-phosphate maltosyltransferase [Zeaxanthinibacter sp. PT1]|uniref:alpha-1,4-glucan--maltose-1-phosphate maltosyltransferase n=1 Tax=Zeaxanthinibacter TaxID=561554 RepID=UPI0023498D55|nr:alpha-1,4-glucan--maltose-1-phosphate maltosyltransferase [Zeaxanthinibacter sp. PT1]MDC6352027.1 alpha-1,4-glucan--maltose-1-phosphate maltosyltransferase [Zeaxanthinibacter sp. PT1]
MYRQQRVVIEDIKPQLQCGAFFIKRVVDETVTVSADILPDGHDVMQAEVRYRHEDEKTYRENRMEKEGNDRYSATFKVEKQGFYEYYIRGWVDYALNWQHGIEAKLKDAQHVKSELLDGVQYLEYLQSVLKGKQKQQIAEWASKFQDDNAYDQAVQIAVSDDLHQLFLQHPQRILANESKVLKVYVDRKKANFSTWYEFFPRSASMEEGKHGTFKDCERLLPRIANMGFDVLYFPPIHPIGEVNRKGKNNATKAREGDSGVPWGIGSRHGGHKAIHPELGTEDDFKQLISSAGDHGIEIAMDLAFQAAPDHPYVSDRPEWFRKRPDGTIQYAENPPKKYQDIVNFYFETPAYKELWQELLSVTLKWVNFGIRIFRVDNPHTKPYYFWHWLIAEVKKVHPDVLFLAEAFSRPRIMQQLAKQGFSQSYTYFTWRVNKHELTEYMTELTQSEMREYYRPNFWPNTPDINPYHLQGANEAMHLIRYALAATLCGNLGIYGPVFEFMETEAIPGKEEYLNCEKYEIRHWDWNHENKLTYLITRINEARKQYRSLQQTNNIRFCFVENDQLLAFHKWSDDHHDETLVVISLDPHHEQQGIIQLPLDSLGIAAGHRVEVRDVITENTYTWNQEWNFVALNPNLPFHIFHLNK